MQDIQCAAPVDATEVELMACEAKGFTTMDEQVPPGPSPTPTPTPTQPKKPREPANG